jgi:selenide,water dikinase
VRFPEGKALVQTVDFFTPIVNDPYWFGQISAANAMSDVYAMGGDPYTAMNIVCFPVKKMSNEILKKILEGGLDKIKEAGAVLAGGHSVRDDELKYGLAVTGVVDPQSFASNKGLKAGDHLLLTKPLGTGVLATALKAEWEGSDQIEKIICKWGAKLNKAGSKVIQVLGLKGATDVTGFGLGGHLLEITRASGTAIELWLSRIPFIEKAVELAGAGLIPGGSHANRKYYQSLVEIDEKSDDVLVDLVFDAQTSGGLVLSIPEDKIEQASEMLLEAGDLAAHIGRVVPDELKRGKLRIG